MQALPPDLAVFAASAGRAREAQEKLRQRAEGYGQPILSAAIKDSRIVLVGGKPYGGNWRFFTDFLLAHMKVVLGRGWITAMQRSGSKHPLIQWLARIDEISKEQRSDKGIVEAHAEPIVLAIFQIAYALYLIAHHDRIPPPLRKRLKRANEFRFAALETVAVAAFALAGYKIGMGEVRKGGGQEGEFSAASPKTGKTFNIEVKTKQAWKALTDLNDAGFQKELATWIQSKLYLAARKGLENPVYWLELSLPGVREQDRAEELFRHVREALREAEQRIRIGGDKPTPAYVFVTSHAYLADEPKDDSNVVMLDGFHIRIPQKGDRIEVEQALSERDRDRDITWVFDCLQSVQRVPQNFDGVPNALMEAGVPAKPRLQVGERLEVTFQHQPNVRGVVTHVVSAGPIAHVMLFSEEAGGEVMVQVPLSEQEQRAAAEYGDIVFGNPSDGKPLPDHDPLAIYDFFLEAYAKTPRELLLEQIKDHPRFSEFSALSDDDLRTRLCREWAKSVLGNHSRPSPGKEEHDVSQE
jgi:hypothetical protein